MAKIQPFYEKCSSENCDATNAYVKKYYDRVAHKKKKPAKRRKGGLDVRVLEPARVGIIGERGEFIATQHGIGVEFKRCYEFEFIDKTTHKQTTKTCTERRVVNIPQNTLRCYEDVASLLTALKRGKKGKPTIQPKILAAVACSRSSTAPTRVAEPIPPSVISVITMEKLKDVRKSLEPLVKSGKISCHGKFLSVLEEKQCSMPKDYQKAFDEFVKSEKEERKWSGFRKLFGDYVDTEALAVPEPMDGFAEYRMGTASARKPKRRHVKPFTPTRKQMFW